MALICNLVQEFNGLVSKGSAAMLALLLCTNPPKKRAHFSLSPQKIRELYNYSHPGIILVQYIPFLLTLLHEQSKNRILLF